MDDRALTVRQPWADLIMAGGKDVENRTRPVPSTIPQWGRCECGRRFDNPGYLSWDPPGGVHLTDGCGGAIANDGPFPFRLWIHAAQMPSTDFEAWRAWDEHVGHGGTEPDHHGVLLGTVEVTGHHHADACATTHVQDHHDSYIASYRYCSRWAQPDRWHWTLTDPQPLDVPIPARGQLGLWHVPAEVSA